ncbi:MAG: hypothetical protein Q27BB25_04435 [Blastomonas sp. CACIA14H2]|uniref:hypothetical protein n=1 Tax=Blastomonas sp. CACIA14H2 TaxID=1419876 RepID=UPI0003D02846|nr:MAG: hypothetical protein Q27BB25_04435 [Blastomonas sp. CACIA14H2]
MSDPIQAQYHGLMQGLAEGIDGILNGDTRPRHTAFVLLVSGFGQIEGGRVNYISNGSREDMIAMMKEYIARNEGRYVEEEGHA